MVRLFIAALLALLASLQPVMAQSAPGTPAFWAEDKVRRQQAADILEALQAKRMNVAEPTVPADPARWQGYVVFYEIVDLLRYRPNAVVRAFSTTGAPVPTVDARCVSVDLRWPGLIDKLR